MVWQAGVSRGGGRSDGADGAAQRGMARVPHFSGFSLASHSNPAGRSGRAPRPPGLRAGASRGPARGLPASWPTLRLRPACRPSWLPRAACLGVAGRLDGHRRLAAAGVDGVDRMLGKWAMAEQRRRRQRAPPVGGGRPWGLWHAPWGRGGGCRPWGALRRVHSPLAGYMQLQRVLATPLVHAGELPGFSEHSWARWKTPRCAANAWEAQFAPACISLLRAPLERRLPHHLWSWPPAMDACGCARLAEAGGRWKQANSSCIFLTLSGPGQRAPP